MIYRTITTTVKVGKMSDARQLHLDVAAYVTEKYGHKVEVLSRVSGASNQLILVGHHDSLASLEQVFTKYREDPKVQEFMAQLPNVIENNTEVGLFRVES